MWATVVQGLSRGPVGVAEQAGLCPTELTFRVRGKPQPKVNAGVVQQSGDEGCGDNRKKAVYFELLARRL